jgi:hypothetical protein
MSQVCSVVRVLLAPLAVGASAAAAAAAVTVSNEALENNASCVDMPHCHNCRCPVIGQNASNDLCKNSAKVGSAHFKRPPCVWADSDSTMIENANKAARFRLNNWGTFVDDEAEWPAQKFQLGDEVKTRVLSTENSMSDVQGTIVGCFLFGIATTSPRTSMYYIRSPDGKYYYCTAKDTMKNVVAVSNLLGDKNDAESDDFQPSPQPQKKRARGSNDDDGSTPKQKRKKGDGKKRQEQKTRATRGSRISAKTNAFTASYAKHRCYPQWL